MLKIAVGGKQAIWKIWGDRSSSCSCSETPLPQVITNSTGVWWDGRPKEILRCRWEKWGKRSIRINYNPWLAQVWRNNMHQYAPMILMNLMILEMHRVVMHGCELEWSRKANYLSQRLYHEFPTFLTLKKKQLRVKEKESSFASIGCCGFAGHLYLHCFIIHLTSLETHAILLHFCYCSLYRHFLCCQHH